MASTNLMIVATDFGLFVLTPAGVVGQISFLNAPDVQFLAGVRPRFACLNRFTVMVNNVSQPVWVDTDAVPHYLSLVPPAIAPIVGIGAGSGLTGAYKARVQFLVKDANGNVVGQSPLGPESAAQSLSNQSLGLSAIPLSPQTGINARRVYRTLTNGSIYFQELDIDNNTTAAIDLSTPDAAISQFASPLSTDLGTAPNRLTNVCVWKGRLWGVSASDPDTLVGTAPNDACAWPLSFPLGPRMDVQGIYGFLPRRDELAVLKRGLIWKMTGDAAANFKPILLVDGIGSGAPDSCQVIQDTGYFLGGPKNNVTGVFTWSAQGVASISDDTVQAWFTSDTYFNRAMFPNAVGGYDPIAQAYVLFLAAPGSTVLDRWIAFDLNMKHWMGPHKTGAFTPAGAFVGWDSGGHAVLMVCGADGNVYRSAHADGASTAIDFDIFSKPFCGTPPRPDRMHVWMRPTIKNRIQAGGAFTVTPYPGSLAAVAGNAQTVSMLTDHKVLDRLGIGAFCKLEIRHNVANEPVELYGLDLPYATKGRR
jgi:hypothetical protein